jgi:hypothetical protein
MQITASCSGLAFYGDAGTPRQHALSWCYRSPRPWRGRAMRVSVAPEAQCERVCQSDRFMSFEPSRPSGGNIMGPGERRAYRGSWAEQRVVARLATKRTRKATRMTTTPPTVIRSQKSELSRGCNSCFPVITNVLTSSFTVLNHGCSDQDHRQTVCPPPAQRGVASPKVFPIVFQERRFA